MDDEDSEAVVAMIDALDEIQDRDTFMDFVDALRRDLDDEWTKEQENPMAPRLDRLAKYVPVGIPGGSGRLGEG